MHLFITFEGGDGSGKTSQAQMLCQRLESSGFLVKLAHEPGGTLLSEMVSVLLRTKKLARRVYIEWFNSQSWSGLDPRTELLLFEAARAQLVTEVIRPCLDRGGIVICDRFTDSTLAYQGYGRGLELDLVRKANVVASQGLTPEITVLLDVPSEISLSRKGMVTGTDRIGREKLDFHQRVREGYLNLARAEPHRWLIVKGDQPRETISQIIWHQVESLLDKRGDSTCLR